MTDKDKKPQRPNVNGVVNVGVSATTKLSIFLEYILL